MRANVTSRSQGVRHRTAPASLSLPSKALSLRGARKSPLILVGAASPNGSSSLAVGKKKLTGACIVLMHGEKTVSADVVQRTEPGATLQEYMSKASENFSNISLPMGGKISTAGPNQVELVIPRIALFDVWLQPRALADLSTYNECIEFISTTESCVLDGSSHVKDFKLDERFNLDVKMVFTWKNKVAGTQGGADATGPSSSGLPPPLHTHDKIYASGNITIEVDIPPPFSFIPKPVLESTANAAMDGSIALILNTFVTRLSEDYGVWAQAAVARQQPGAQAASLKEVVAR